MHLRVATHARSRAIRAALPLSIFILAALAAGPARAQMAPIPSALDRSARPPQAEKEPATPDERERKPVRPEDSGFFLGLDLYAGFPKSSQTRVRENQDQGNVLKFTDDLGINVIAEARRLVRSGRRTGGGRRCPRSAPPG